MEMLLAWSAELNVEAAVLVPGRSSSVEEAAERGHEVADR